MRVLLGRGLVLLRLVFLRGFGLLAALDQLDLAAGEGELLALGVDLRDLDVVGAVLVEALAAVELELAVEPLVAGEVVLVVAPHRRLVAVELLEELDVERAGRRVLELGVDVGDPAVLAGHLVERVDDGRLARGGDLAGAVDLDRCGADFHLARVSRGAAERGQRERRGERQASKEVDARCACHGGRDGG
ncbi:hypothetical protein [Nannocystis pusilla]|uniref:hypothetical protein n=1 Tax=Nannocystis pusilla TaxID=889268 RepID=UPI003B80AC72